MNSESIKKSTDIIKTTDSKNNIKGIIFDFDGVLSSFQARIGWPILNAALRVKPDLTKNQIRDGMIVVFDTLTTMNTHPNSTKMIRLIFDTGKRYGMSNFQAFKFVLTTVIIYAKNRKRIVPRTGVREVLAELLNQGYQIALLTNSSESIIEVARKKIPEIEKFDLILTRDDFEFIKPSADGFLYILKTLNLDADEVISVGDQATDIIASRRAKIKSIAIFDEGMKFTKPQLAKENPNFIIGDLRDIPELLVFIRDRIIEDIRTTIDLTDRTIKDYILEHDSRTQTGS